MRRLTVFVFAIRLVRGLVLGLVLGLAVPVRAAPIRMFAVGHKVRIADGVSYQAFHDKMAALMDAAFPGRALLVQDGVDDVASHLAGVDPSAPARALVVFPEDTGLVAALIGSRGVAARTASDAVGAIVALAGPYAAPSAYYAAKFPNQPPVRNLLLAITDTFYRAFYETFRELAMTHGVYLAAAANVPVARKVDKATADPMAASALADPDEPGRTYFYEAVSPLPHNTTFVFAPDGEVLVPDGQGGLLRSPTETDGVLRGSTDKAYLTPIEEPPPYDQIGLQLAFGPVRDLEVLDTPVGRLAIVISKDAWMPDVNDRFAAKGANVILQPEAFSEWGYAAVPWQPDIFKEGGFATLQKIAAFRVNVDASMTGNFFDITFDGQSAILGRKQKSAAGPLGPANAWIGQNPDTGFLALAPWIVPDPGIATPNLPLAMRRLLLATSGASLLPRSGVACGGALVVGACENGYREAVVWTDVDPSTTAVDPVRAAPPHFERAVRASGTETTPAAQHDPKIAVAGSRVYVVWHEARGDGLSNVYLAMSRNGGRTFGKPVHVSSNAAGTVAELHPAIAVRNSRLYVAWQEFSAGRDDDHGRIKVASLKGRGARRFPEVHVDGANDAGKWLPAVAIVGRDPVVAWVDERDTGPEGEPLEHIYAARGRRSGKSFTAPVRVDAGAPVALAAHVDNKWGPTLTVDGQTVYAAWTDFRNYNWDIFTARSDDGGGTWSPNVRVDDFDADERLDERPSLAVGRAGRLHVAWTDLRAREADTNVFYARSDDRGATFSANVQLDDSKAGFDPDADTPTNQWHPSLVADADRLFVAWQDDRLGNDDIFFTTSNDGGASFAPAERVDDTGAGASTQTRPSLALGGRGRKRRCYVAWEDDRSGDADVYTGRRSCDGRPGA